MKIRKAFTLVELLVVIGIIALLAGILLPAVNHMRRSAQMTGQRADFASIESALNAYKADFGDYPRNINLPTWNMLATGTPMQAPFYYSLAPSLLGPGPAVTEPIGVNVENGDGSDGPGFRCQTAGGIPSAGPVTVTSGASTVMMPVSNQYLPQASAFKNNFVTPSGSSPSSTPASITFFPNLLGSPPAPYPEAIGITSVSLAGNTLTLTLSSPTAAAHNGTCLVTQLGGKVWGPYISADTFKVAFLPNADVNANPINSLGGYGQPVLLDRWGQVIQYFPTYGQVSNRANDSCSFINPTQTQLAAITAGPLYGYSQPWSLEGKSAASLAQNAIWDSRDGAPFYTVGGGSGPAFCQLWQDVTAKTGITQYFFHPEYALQWMLGDQPDPSTNKLDNVITSSEKLSYTGPYILISAGPDGPNRANGGFCNMVDPNSTTDTPLPANQWQQTFINSGNIYNFDRQ